MQKTSLQFIFITMFALGSFSSASGEAIARVMKTNGDVFLKRFGTNEFTEQVNPGIAIENGDAIRVGEPGFAVVIFIDDRSVVKIRENTEFQFVDSPNTRTLDIDNGTILNNIKDQGRTKTFRVETPTSVASVKGTQFSCVIDPSGVDQFYGSEGTVEVFNTISGQTVSLTAGNKVISNVLGNLVEAPANPNEYPQDPDPDADEQPTEPTEDETPQEPEGEPGAEEPGAQAPPETPTQPETPPGGMGEPGAEEPAEEPETGGEGGAESPFGMGLGIGSVTIDGVIYNQLALRPEFRFGKLGVGLDLVVYIDNEGNIRTDEWAFIDDPSQILDKVLYIRWAKKGDPFWARWGSLENVTLGYGGLVSGYSNMMEFPTIRRIGVNTGIQMKNFGAEIFMANIKDFARGGTLMGLRGTYRISKSFPLTFGFNVAADINQFSGLKDQDGDSYPDIFDDFKDNENLWKDTDGDGWPDPHPGLDSSKWDIDADGDNIYDDDENTSDVNLKSDPFSTKDEKARAIGFAVDVGYPIFSNKLFSLMAYSEVNMLNFPEVTALDRPKRSGTGITVPGIRAQILKFLNVSVEYRIKQDYYVPQYFDQAYDMNRVVPVFTSTASGNDTAYVFTKDMLLFGDPTSKINSSGIFGAASGNILNFATLSASYTRMVADTIQFNSFYALLDLNAEMIPKLSVAQAYYQRNNDENPFDFANPSENTILGYRLGYAIAEGVSLIWDFRQFYRDTGAGLEPVKQTTIETAFTF